MFMKSLTNIDSHRYQHCCEKEKGKTSQFVRAKDEKRKLENKKKRNTYKDRRKEKRERERERECTASLLSLVIVFFSRVCVLDKAVYKFEWCLITQEDSNINLFVKKNI